MCFGWGSKLLGIVAGCLVATGLVATGFCCVATGPVEYTTELGVVVSVFSLLLGPSAACCQKNMFFFEEMQKPSKLTFERLVVPEMKVFQKNHRRRPKDRLKM